MAGKKDSGTEETCEIKNVSKPDKKKVESGKGKEAGIQEEERYGKYGRKYYALVHTRESQEMILGELREYLADLTDE